MTTSLEPAIIVFDGSCMLCGGWVRFLLRHDRRGRYRFAAMQTPAGGRLLAQHGLDVADPDSFLLIDARGARTDSDAVIDVLVSLGGGWRVCALVRAIPKPWRDAAYRCLARNRYRWFGQRDSCLIATADERARFIGIDEVGNVAPTQPAP